MTHEHTLRELTDRDRAAWRKHNLETLLDGMALSFGEKLMVLQDLEEMTIALGYTRDVATGRLTKPIRSSGR